jgi:hypothetical protein
VLLKRRGAGQQLQSRVWALSSKLQEPDWGIAASVCFVVAAPPGSRGRRERAATAPEQQTPAEQSAELLFVQERAVVPISTRSMVEWLHWLLQLVAECLCGHAALFCPESGLVSQSDVQFESLHAMTLGQYRWLLSV